MVGVFPDPVPFSAQLDPLYGTKRKATVTSARNS